MKTLLLAPFLVLLSIWGHYFSPVSASPSSPSLSAQVVQKNEPTRPSAATTTPRAKKPVPKAQPQSVQQKQKAVPIAEPIQTSPQPASKVEPSQPKPTPPPASSTATGFATDVETYILELTNAERAKSGLAPLSYDATLASLSRAHSADMLENNYFSHTDQNGCASACRANAVEYAWQAIGENIYMSKGYEVSAREEAEMTVEGWMNSSGHRANILSPKYTHSGVGVFVQGESVYITAMYSNPR